MVKWLSLITSVFCLSISCSISSQFLCSPALAQRQLPQKTQVEPFIIKPYLQLGQEAKSDATAATVIWFTSNDTHKWTIFAQSGKTTQFKPVDGLFERLVALPGFSSPIKKYTARLKKLTPGEPFHYAIQKDGITVFEAAGTAKKTAAQPYKVAIFGDCGANSPGQREIANTVFKAKPDFIVIPGDIVYKYGLYSQYMTNFFPVYNSDPKPNTGAHDLSVPLMRSIFMVGVLGNHDIALDGNATNFDTHNDAMAYFLFWDQPLNGFGTEYGAKNTPPIAGAENKQILFKKSVGDTYPQMANFSFDYGNGHWTVLDANYYMDWNDEKTRKWLIDDLKKAQSATWRFVTFHQPAFSIDAAHGAEQRMRMISDILDKYKVDIVFAGHAHCYERSHPLVFTPKDGTKKFTLGPKGTVDGVFKLDQNFDGKTKTDAVGTIHIVTGAGGAQLYPPGSSADYIKRFDCSDFSYTNMEVADKRLTIKQISAKGKVLDHFVMTK